MSLHVAFNGHPPAHHESSLQGALFGTSRSELGDPGGGGFGGRDANANFVGSEGRLGLILAIYFGVILGGSCGGGSWGALGGVGVILGVDFAGDLGGICKVLKNLGGSSF